MKKKLFSWWKAECRTARHLNADDEDYSVTNGNVVVVLAVVLTIFATQIAQYF